MVTDQEIEATLKEHGLTAADLTKNELNELREEIEASKQGYMVLDGVLHNRPIY